MMHLKCLERGRYSEIVCYEELLLVFMMVVAFLSVERTPLPSWILGLSNPVGSLLFFLPSFLMAYFASHDRHSDSNSSIYVPESLKEHIQYTFG